MKNKKVIYILLPLVILIWGIIGFRIYSGFSDQGNPVTTFEPEAIKSAAISSDSLTLLLNYADPFLRSQKPVKITNKNASAQEKKIVRTQPAPTISWPSITYSGMIKNKTVNKIVGLMSLNGNSVMIKEGEIVDGLKVMKIYKDSVQLALGKNIKYFKK